MKQCDLCKDSCKDLYELESWAKTDAIKELCFPCLELPKMRRGVLMIMSTA